MQADCLFCKLVSGEIPAKKVAEGDHWLAFHDIKPEAPTHVLVIPKTHVASLAEVQEPQIFADVFAGVQAVAKQLGISEFRTVVNTGADAGQTVFHLHVHLLAGRSFGWPPG